MMLTACGVLALSAGCGKNEPVAPPTAKDSQTPANAAVTQPPKAVETPSSTADAEKTAQTATAAAAQETARIQGLIDSAKNVTGQNKDAEALKILGELANLKLTPEQQALVDGLKQTAEKQAAQAVAAKAASGLLGGKK